MDPKRLRRKLEDFRRGKLSLETLMRQLRALPFRELGFARADTHRALRCGFPEVIYCQGKTRDQVRAIAREILTAGSNVLATRAGRAVYNSLRSLHRSTRYHLKARAVTIQKNRVKPSGRPLMVVTAGTADIPVAEEACVTASMMGCQVKKAYDVGVAGVHRLFTELETLQGAGAIIVVAGMEGALASVVAGLVACPVVAVPTSVGYGASFEGLAPLLTMLNSCANGVGVVNIDNGFGAGYLAGLILRSRTWAGV